MPDIGDFPFQALGKLLAASWTSPPVGLATHFDARGYRPLREAIADHLKAVRLVECGCDQVIITAGAQNALDMTARLLLDPGSRVWIGRLSADLKARFPLQLISPASHHFLNSMFANKDAWIRHVFKGGGHLHDHLPDGLY